MKLTIKEVVVSRLTMTPIAMAMRRIARKKLVSIGF